MKFTCNNATITKIHDRMSLEPSTLRTWRLTEYVVVCVLAVITCFHHAVHASTTIPARQLPYRLKTYTVNAVGLDVAIIVNPCHDEHCDISLNLLKNDRVLDTKTLEWALPNYQGSASPGNAFLMMTETTHLNGMSSFHLTIGDHEANEMTIDMKVLHANDDEFSVVCVQRAGFESESVAEHYEIFRITGEHLTRVFHFSANIAMQQTSTWETADIDDNGFDNVIVIEEWEIADPEIGGDTKRFYVYPVPNTLTYYAIILATFPTIEDALKTKFHIENTYACLQQNLFILNTNDYPFLTPNLYIVGDIVIRKNEAVSVLNTYKECTQIHDAYITRAK